MDKKWVERALLNRAAEHVLAPIETWRFGKLGIQEAAAAIAQAHEEEIAEAIRDWVALRDEAQAQVAVMGHLAAECIGVSNTMPRAEATRQLKRALSAVPRVLHHETGKWDAKYLIWPVVRLKRPLMLDARSPDDVMPGVIFCAHGPQRFDEFPGQQVDVLVLAYEQAQEIGQEESGGQEGD